MISQSSAGASVAACGTKPRALSNACIPTQPAAVAPVDGPESQRSLEREWPRPLPLLSPPPDGKPAGPQDTV